MIAARDALFRHAREKHRREQALHPQAVRPHSKFSLLLIVGLMAIGVIAAISFLQFAIEAMGGGAG